MEKKIVSNEGVQYSTQKPVKNVDWRKTVYGSGALHSLCTTVQIVTICSKLSKASSRSLVNEELQRRQTEETLQIKAVANVFLNAGFYIGLSFEKVSSLFCLPSSVFYIVRILV